MIFTSLLFLGHRSLHGATFSALARELIVGARIKRQNTFFEVQYSLYCAVEQATVVADYDDRVGVLGKVCFKPKGTFKVKVVGRFI